MSLATLGCGTHILQLELLHGNKLPKCGGFGPRMGKVSEAVDKSDSWSPGFKVDEREVIRSELSLALPSLQPLD